MTKGRAKPVKRKPPTPDAFALDFATWPESAWRSPRRTWLISLVRCDNGQRERKSIPRATYGEACIVRDEYLATGVYESAWLIDVSK